MNEANNALTRLRTVLRAYPRLAIAVSGGVDSMTLAHVAVTTVDAQIVHAISPAVPTDATERVRDHALRFDWNLVTTDAGEFGDPRYTANPSNRCYFCKTNLYDRISVLTERPIASGANLDDLDDDRPGLIAAWERQVVHPLILAEITKLQVRQIARHLGLDDLSEIAAQPCLSSRVETGIAINPDDLAFIEGVERAVRSLAPDLENVRCRVMHRGVVLEIDEPAGERRDRIEARVRSLISFAGRALAETRPYRRGSAFAGHAGLKR